MGLGDRGTIRTCDRLLRRQMLYPAELRDLAKFMSGWQDSNLRPPRPKRGAITGLRYTPKMGANIKLFILTTNTNFYINFG